MIKENHGILKPNLNINSTMLKIIIEISRKFLTNLFKTSIERLNTFVINLMVFKYLEDHTKLL